MTRAKMEASDVEKPTALEETHRLQMSLGKRHLMSSLAYLKCYLTLRVKGGGGVRVHVA